MGSGGGPWGLIPAHAGKTTASKSNYLTDTAHPRSRGENLRAVNTNSSAPGSSPLTRGKRPRQSGRLARMGLIPAHAGKTVGQSRASRPCAAHPRSRGENEHDVDAIAGEAGSSPLTRGKRSAEGQGRRRRRLIPAHAGKTRRRRRIHLGWRAHPRSRGENRAVENPRPHVRGSSPLTRGKRT